eukprot:m.44214 g.44214  ORF g.44214 m.44214 type:complete len:3379 (-) comp6188_c0_seq3:109-10245(-)
MSRRDGPHRRSSGHPPATADGARSSRHFHNLTGGGEQLRIVNRRSDDRRARTAPAMRRELATTKTDFLRASSEQQQRNSKVLVYRRGWQLPPKISLEYAPGNSGSPRKAVNVEISQQQNGGASVVVFRDRVRPGTVFSFASKRLLESAPFGLTIFCEGKRVARVSTCCEYRHAPGMFLGTKASGFRVHNITGGSPCLQCQLHIRHSIRTPSVSGSSADPEEDLSERDLQLEEDSDDGDNSSFYSLPPATPVPSRPHMRTEDRDRTPRAQPDTRPRSAAREESALHTKQSLDSVLGRLVAKPTTPFKVQLFTSSVPGAATTAQVSIEVFGLDRQGRNANDTVTLAPNTVFAEGSVVQVRTNFEDVVEPRTILVGHDNTGEAPDWHLSKICLQNTATGEIFVFPCDQWLSSSRGDGCTNRTLTLQVFSHMTATVTTSAGHFQGTTAHVQLTLHGTLGDSPAIPLKSARGFRPGSVDVFDFDFEDVGELQAITIEHDNAGDAPEWHLQQIELREQLSRRHYLFRCNQWLDMNREDGLIKRHLRLVDTADDIPYNMTIVTNPAGASVSDVDVSITISGETRTGSEECDYVFLPDSSFDAGASSRHAIKLARINRPRQVHVAMSSSHARHNWHLQRIILRNTLTSAEYIFACKSPLSQANNSVMLVEGSLSKYQLNVKTSNMQQAGTDGDVSFRLCGDKGTSQPVLATIGSSRAKFFPSSTTSLAVECEDVGSISALVVEHSHPNDANRWHLDQVEVYDEARRKTYLFVCRKWLDASGECATQRLELQRHTDRNPFTVQIFSEQFQSRGYPTVSLNVQGRTLSGDPAEDSMMLEDDDVVTANSILTFQRSLLGVYDPLDLVLHAQCASITWRPCKVVLTNKRSLKQSIFLLAEQDTAAVDCEGNFEAHYRLVEPIPYEVTVTTANVAGASTRAGVELKFHGTEGETDFAPLVTHQGTRPEFCEGSTLHFQLSAADVGDLRMASVRHNNQGDSPSWLLEKLEVLLPTYGRRYTFRCGEWLASDRADGLLERSLPARKSAEEIPYTISFFTGNDDCAGTDASVFLRIHGRDEEGNQYHDTLHFTDKSHARFEAGHCDVFLRDVNRVMVPEQIVVGHNDQGEDPSWQVHKVVLRNNRTNVEYPFLCNSWLASDRGDKQCQRTISYIDLCTYDIMLTTPANGNTSRLGSEARDAPCSLQLELRTADGCASPITMTRDRAESKSVELPALGPLTSVRLFGFSAPEYATWDIEKVVVFSRTESKHYEFLIDHTFSHDASSNDITGKLFDENGIFPFSFFIFREAGSDIPPELQMTVVSEEDESQATFVAKLPPRTIVTGPISFNRALYGVSRPSEVHITSTKGKMPRWHLDKMVLVNNKTQETFTFDHHGIVDLQSPGDQVVLRPTELCEYLITVITSGIAGAGTSSNVDLTLYAEGGRTERIALSRECLHEQQVGDELLFAEGSTRVFAAGLRHMELIQRVRVHVSGEGSSPRWHLSAIEVLNVTLDKSVRFVLSDWIGDQSGCADERMLGVWNDGLLDPYDIHIATSDIKHAATSSSVQITVQGVDRDNRSASDLVLAAPPFEQGQTKLIEQALRVSIPHAIVVEMVDVDGQTHDWHLSHISMRNANTGKAYFFLAQTWLSDKTATSQRRVVLKPSDTSEYRIVTRVSNHAEAGTTSPVLAILHGSRGSSWPIPLSSDGVLHHGQDHVATCRAEAIGQLQSVEVFYPEETPATSSVHLDELWVSQNDSTPIFFPCRRWLAERRGDGSTKRILLPREPDTGVPFELLFYAPNGAHKPLPSWVSLEVIGEHSDEHDEQLSDIVFLNAPRGNTDSNDIVMEHEATLRTEQPAEIILSFENTDRHCLLDVEKVILRNVETDTEYVFPIDRNSEDEFEFQTVIRAKLFRLSRYEIRIATSNFKRASTSASACVRLYVRRRGVYSQHGDFVEILPFGATAGVGPTDLAPLTQNAEPFQAGQVDIFSFDAEDTGDISYITVEHDGAGDQPDWHLKHIEVIVSEHAHSFCRGYMFLCNRWLSKRFEDRLTTRTLYPRDLKAEVPYEIEIHTTKDISDADTDANVSLEICGLSEGQREIVDFVYATSFCGGRLVRSAPCRFEHGLLDMERPTQITVQHDNTGLKPDWHLHKIVMRNLRNHNTYTFLYDRWLSSRFDDRAVTRTSLPTNISEYHIVVKTSDLPRAGTESQVFVELFGDSGASTGPIMLVDSVMSVKKFGRGHQDAFRISCPHIGMPVQVAVWLDSKSQSSEWHLEKIEIDTDFSDELRVFPCYRWLSLRRDDRKNKRTLYARSSEQQPYDVYVTTGTRADASTDSNVTISILGSDGDEGRPVQDVVMLPPSRLISGGTAKSTHMLSVENPIQLVVSHDGSGRSPSWFLERIKLVNRHTRVEYCFPCGQWLAKDKGDGRTWRELSCAPMTLYRLSITTGERSRTGVPHSAFVEIFGEASSTGKILIDPTEENPNRGSWLRRSLTRRRNLRSDACPGQTMLVEVNGRDVGAIRSILVGHSERSESSSAWYLDQVDVFSEAQQRRYSFPCQEWFDNGTRQRSLQCIEPDTPTASRAMDRQHPFRISVYTSSIDGAGTSAKATLVVQDAQGQEQLVPLSSSSGFQTGTCTECDVMLRTEKPVQICLGTDGSGGSPTWHVDRVVLLDRSTSRSYTFLAGCWIGGRNPNQVTLSITRTVSYAVRVKTSDIRFAGTDANIKLALIGSEGETSPILLEHSRTHRDPFERGHLDEFLFEGADVGEIQRVRVFFEPSGRFADWHLEFVVVEVCGHEYVFPCVDWFTKTTTERVLVARNLAHELLYEIGVFWDPVTSHELRGTVTLAIHGRTSRGEEAHESIELDAGGFGRSGSYWSSTTLVDIEKPHMVSLTHDSAHKLFLTKVILKHDAEETQFLCRRWLSPDAIDIYRMENTTYEIAFETAADNGGPLQLAPKLVFSGDRGVSDIVSLAPTSPFDAGTVATLQTTELPDFGNLSRLEVLFDTESDDIRWHLQCVHVTNMNSGASWLFPCDRWLSGEPVTLSAEDSRLADSWVVSVFTSQIQDAGISSKVMFEVFGTDGNGAPLHHAISAKRDFEAGTSQTWRTMLPELVIPTKLGICHGEGDSDLGASWHLEKIELTNSRNETFTFICRDWIRKGCTSTLERRPLAKYRVAIVTANVENAGTSAQVYFELHGSAATSSRVYFPSSSSDSFRPGATVKHVFEVDDVGDVEQITLGHDGSGSHPDWLPASVTVQRESGHESFFACSNWLTGSENNSVTLREIKSLWCLALYTQNLEPASATVSFVIHEKELMEERQIACTEYSRDEVISVDLSLQYIQAPDRIQIEVDEDSQPFQLEKVVLVSLRDQTELTARSGHWFGGKDAQYRILELQPGSPDT